MSAPRNKIEIKSDMKTAIVTGGSRGIGRAIALMLAEEGCTVAINYNNNYEEAQCTLNKIKEKGARCAAFKSDISSFENAAIFVKECKKYLGNVDVLINNAGIIRDKPLFMMKEKYWSELIDLNLKGYFNMTNQIIVDMLKRKKGRIINISSVSGIVGMIGQTNYCASKAGIIGFTKALAKECARANITVNCVAPGFIETDMTKQLSDKIKTKIITKIPMGRLGTVDDVAETIRFLIFGKSQYITGQVLTVDGGLSA